MIDEILFFEIEYDILDVAIFALLNQRGCPMAFMSRTLQSSELNYYIVAKKATAIIETV